MLRPSCRALLALVTLGLIVANRAEGQSVPLRGPVGATTIQLPTFNFFAVSTSVDVPDSGEGFLGAASSSTAGSSQRGIPGLGFRPFSNSAAASSGLGGGMSVRATIHDFDAMDKALLGKDFDDASGGAAVRNGRSAPSILVTDSAGGSSLAEIRRQQAADDAAANAEAQKIIDRGKAYEAAGKPGLAKIQYRMAAHQANGALKQQALADLQRLTAPTRSAPAGEQSP